MVMRRHIKITRDEVIHYLYMESSIVIGMIASVVASLIGFFFTFLFIHLLRFITIPTNDFYILGVIALVTGIVIYFIKRQEYILYEKSSSNVFLVGVFVFPILIIIYTVIFLNYLIPVWSSMQSDVAFSYFAAVITVTLVSSAFSYFFHGIWKMTDYLILNIFAHKDWIILAEKEYFVTGLGFRFEEAKRYGTSLSIVNISINLPISKKATLKRIFGKISSTLREIDSISHFENWNDIVILAPITQPAAESMYHRIIQVIREELDQKGEGENVKISGKVSAIQPDSESEYDMLNSFAPIE